MLIPFFKQISSWWAAKEPRDVLLEALADSNLYEEYEAAAFQLDEVLGYDLWRQNPTSKYYDYRLIYQRLQAITTAREEDDILGLVSLLRSGLVRNLGNITASRLFNRAYAGTKLLIEDYITQVALAVDHVTSYPVTADSGLTTQNKLDVLHDTRQAFGRSVLVLQGGAIFGLCHLGVVKALHLRGLLPRIISGTATGALIAALVGVHTEDELLDFLKGESIDLTAFTGKVEASRQGTWYQTVMRRIRRFIRDGYFLDVSVLEQVVRANVSDLTFEEAYLKTKRVLNITVSTTGGGGVPDLLNYLTAPNVLIWSAALASNASSTLYKQVTLLCKDDAGNITPWSPSLSTTFRPWTHASYADTRESPLHRIAELFNVNHFIVSQARPYLAPFLRSDLHHPNPKQDGRRYQLSMPVLRLIVMEIQHRLHQLNELGILPPSIRRFLLDENIPGPSLTLVPELTPRDFFRLLENPTKDALDYWIRRGEKSVWPAVGALKVRCAVEVELDRGYQLVRRRRKNGRQGEKESPTEGVSSAVMAGERLRKSGSRGEEVWESERRRRAASFGEGSTLLSHTHAG
ncbi:triacylglycerol lipase [Didymosphaeria variabile]|uniref:Triacylglycerol lipase n=1 Tax=Didymosphaeria variabile TaxID=1932322 RepID=A0A9W9CA29_9PLEO|nr:triacylglycerol lipase [Didymosphaeria variabile]KAJ4353286.1 triacylglycerol lipase [Didymosphaeria variabile]